MVPSGSQRVRTGRVLDEKGTKKLEILRLKGSKKVVRSASLACFTITHFSVAKAIFKKYGNTFQKCFTFYQLTLAQTSPRLGGKTYGGSPLTCPRPKILLPRFRVANRYLPPFRGLKIMTKIDEFWVPKWRLRRSKYGKVASQTPLGRVSVSEWRKLVKIVSFQGWPTSLKRSKYKQNLLFFSFALIQILAPFRINFGATWPAICIPK